MATNATSYSELNDFHKCKQYWFNKYVLGLRRTGTTGGPLAFGRLGHLWLEHYYRTLKEINGSNVVNYDERMEAVVRANNELSNALATGRYDVSIYPHLQRILVDYVEIERLFAFDILAVETRYGDVLPREDMQTYDPANPDNVYVSMIADLVIRPHSGRFHGQIGAMDHKFVENFPADIAVMMNAQLPKQIHSLRSNGINATFGVLNHLRYRTVKDRTKVEMFRRKFIEPSDTRVNTLMHEHEVDSRQITYLKNIDPEEARQKVTKVANPLFCGNRPDRECEYLTLCDLELDGKDTKATIEAFFKRKGEK